MAFDIRQPVLDRDGMPVEKKASQYIDQLMELFVQSPEGQALWNEGIEPGWAAMMMEYGINYLTIIPPQMTPDNLREILFDIFPRKVSTTADQAEPIIHELQEFWTFLQREFHLANAAACLKVLDEKAARQLKKELSNPANFGIAKSFVMMGQERGFDMGSEEGINEWMETYNAELASGGLRIPLPGEQSKDAQQFRNKLVPKNEDAQQYHNRLVPKKRKRTRRKK